MGEPADFSSSHKDELGRQRSRTLDRQTEVELIRSAQAGDSSAQEKLIASLERFIAWIAEPYRTSALSVDDLHQAGRIGLLTAIKRFDPTRGVRLSTYAKTFIEDEIRRAVRESHLIQLPREKAVLIARAGQMEQQLAGELGHPPTTEEVASVLDVSPTALWEIAAATRVLVSDEPEAVIEGEDGEDLIASSGGDYTAQEVEALLTSYAQLRGAIETTKGKTERLTRRPRRPEGELQLRILDLERALSRLPQDRYEALEVVALYGLGFREAGEWLGVHANTVRYRYREAMASLVDYLNGVGILPPPQRRVDWGTELAPIETLKLVLRRYEDFFAMLDEYAKTDEWFANLEVGWVQTDEGWIPLLSRDIKATAAAMRANPRPLPKGIRD